MIFLETEGGSILNMAHVGRIIIMRDMIVAEMHDGISHPICQHENQEMLQYELKLIKESLREGYIYIAWGERKRTRAE